MSNKLHIEGGEGRPQAILDYLDLIDQYSYESKEGVVQDAYEQGYQLGEINTKNMLATLTSLGLIQADDQQSLTERGQGLVDVSLYNEELFFELLHVVYSTAYAQNPGPATTISWAYHTVSAYLFDIAPVASFTDAKQDIVDHVMYTAEQSDQPALGEDAGAFSRKSINGYQKFITQLSPAVLEDDRFDLREHTREELIIAAINHVYRSTQIAPTIEYGDLLELSEPVRDEICTVCLLQSDRLDEMLERAAAAYDVFTIEADYDIRVRMQEEIRFHEFT